MLVEPCEEDFLRAKELLASGSFGDARSFAGADEQLMTTLFRGRWRHLHERFCLKSWHAEAGSASTCALHFVSEKPWSPAVADWPDFARWRSALEAALAEPNRSQFHALAGRVMGRRSHVQQNNPLPLRKRARNKPSAAVAALEETVAAQGQRTEDGDKDTNDPLIRQVPQRSKFSNRKRKKLRRADDTEGGVSK